MPTTEESPENRSALRRDARDAHRPLWESAAASGGRRRIVALDVVRGFALCGILVANVEPIAADGAVAVASGTEGTIDWLHLFVDQRFFPIFSLLFGIGFSLLLDVAADRAARPRLVLLAIGLAHMLLLWRGDILTVYAVVGLLVLLPSTWLPRWVVAGLAVVSITASLITLGGPYTLVPGLFLLGSALTRYGVIDRIEHSIRTPAVHLRRRAVQAHHHRGEEDPRARLAE